MRPLRCALSVPRGGVIRALGRPCGAHEEVLMDEQERHSKGMEVRRAVLGNAHVDRAEAKRNDFNGEFQDLITRHAWGEIWTRPGLTRHTRSLLTIGLMVALNRGDEFKLHVRAAFNNGV